MSQRVDALVHQFELANKELIATVERCSDEQWKTKTAGEKWPIGVVAHHVAQGHEPIAGIILTAATGKPMPPLTMDQLNEINAQHAKDYANVTKVETLALLAKAGSAAASTVRGLTDEQLDRSRELMGGTMTVQRMIEQILIGHVREHQGNIATALKAQ
jgi:uncharacterized damage-inducible protein DinB